MAMAEDRQHLAQADRHIAESEQRIAEQIHRLAAMRRSGTALVEAERLLGNLRGTLVELKTHRDLILDRLARRP